MPETKNWNLEVDFHYLLYLSDPHPSSVSFCLFLIKATDLRARWVCISPGYYLKIRIRALIPENYFITNLSPLEELQG